MEKIKYSVIVPVYNAANVLARCVESLLSQTIKDFEIILIDDGSSDESWKVCKKFQELDARVIAISKGNGGVSSARNLGVDMARGKYIVFVDSDDYVTNTYLEDLNEGEDDLVISGVKYKGYGVTNNAMQKWMPRNIARSDKKKITELLLGSELNYVVAKRYKRELIDKNGLLFDENLIFGEDGYFNIQYIDIIRTVRIVDNVNYIYVRYQHETLSTSKLNEKFITGFEMANHKIREKMYDILGKETDNIMRNRASAFYDNVILNGIINSKKEIKYSLIKFLFQQQEFRNTLENVDYGYVNEGKKFKMILKTKSAIVFWFFVKYIKLRKNLTLRLGR